MTNDWIHEEFGDGVYSDFWVGLRRYDIGRQHFVSVVSQNPFIPFKVKCNSFFGISSSGTILYPFRRQIADQNSDNTIGHASCKQNEFNFFRKP